MLETIVLDAPEQCGFEHEIENGLIARTSCCSHGINIDYIDIGNHLALSGEKNRGWRRDNQPRVPVRRSGRWKKPACYTGRSRGRSNNRPHPRSHVARIESLTRWGNSSKLWGRKHPGPKCDWLLGGEAHRPAASWLCLYQLTRNGIEPAIQALADGRHQGAIVSRLKSLRILAERFGQIVQGELEILPARTLGIQRFRNALR